ncbi:MurR/RpiR family transcriptional regulator [Georgenia alba]|uniref:MurR/RpiR family transcriptional regulator n=1 Tax=Georgenia alba TaxID=2233858 RepID=A0ABW2Q821_9MICO
MNATSPEPALDARVAARAGALSRQERAVTEYLLAHPQEFVTSSAARIAAATGTSDATVVRTARSLGYSGLRELKQAALANVAAPRGSAARIERRIDRVHDAPGRVLDQVLADTAAVVHGVTDGLDPAAWDRAVDLLAGAERAWVYGIGPAGLVAQHHALDLTRLGRDVTVVTQTGFSLADPLLDLRGSDVVVVFAPLRMFHEIDVVLRRAAEVGAHTVLVSEALRAEVVDRVDALLTTPETAGTAASEYLGSFVVAHALALELAARDRVGSVAAWELLLRLRNEIAGPTD